MLLNASSDVHTHVRWSVTCSLVQAELETRSVSLLASTACIPPQGCRTTHHLHTKIVRTELRHKQPLVSAKTRCLSKCVRCWVNVMGRLNELLTGTDTPFHVFLPDTLTKSYMALCKCRSSRRSPQESGYRACLPCPPTCCATVRGASSQHRAR